MAKEPATPNNAPSSLPLMVLILAIILGVTWGISSLKSSSNAKYIKQQNEKQAAENYAATHAPAPQQTSQVPTEALVLMYEGWTPCTTFVGWSCKVRTDGDAIRIKYKGCDWFNQPAKGDVPAPKGFQPGEAQIVSSDKNNPHVKVWVYKIITVGR